MPHRNGWVLFTLLGLASCQEPTEESTASAVEPDAERGARMIWVAAPTGVPARDRANIESAIARAEPGDIVQFRAGTYFLDRVAAGPIEVPVQGLTLRGAGLHHGHPVTTLRGGIIRFDEFDPIGFHLTGGHQTVKNIDFVSFSFAILIDGPVGNDLVTHCRFRRTIQPIAALLFGSGKGVDVLQNEFVNVVFPVVLSTSNSRVAGNSITAPNPDNIPLFAQPGNFIELTCVAGTCSGNVFEDNVGEGLSDGFFIGALEGAIARDNIIRRNRITHQRVFTDQDRATFANLFSLGGIVRDNRIVNNEFNGSEGTGIVIEGGIHNTIRDNVITGVQGSPLVPARQRGVGIFLGHSSNRNRLVTNEFSATSGADIKLFGNRNQIVTRGKTTVRDLGEGNVVVAEDGLARAADPTAAEQPAAVGVAASRPGVSKSWVVFGPLVAKALRRSRYVG